MIISNGGNVWDDDKNPTGKSVIGSWKCTHKHIHHWQIQSNTCNRDVQNQHQTITFQESSKWENRSSKTEGIYLLAHSSTSQMSHDTPPPLRTTPHKYNPCTINMERDRHWHQETQSPFTTYNMTILNGMTNKRRTRTTHLGSINSQNWSYQWKWTLRVRNTSQVEKYRFSTTSSRHMQPNTK